MLFDTVQVDFGPARPNPTTLCKSSTIRFQHPAELELGERNPIRWSYCKCDLSSLPIGLAFNSLCLVQRLQHFFTALSFV